MLASTFIIVFVVPQWAVLAFCVFLCSTGVDNLPGVTNRAYLTGSTASLI